MSVALIEPVEMTATLIAFGATPSFKNGLVFLASAVFFVL